METRDSRELALYGTHKRILSSYRPITVSLLATWGREDQCVQPLVAVGRLGEIVQLVAPLQSRGVEFEDPLLEN